MTQHVRLGALCAGLLVPLLGVALLPAKGAVLGKDFKEPILQIAEAIKKGDKGAATSQATELAKKIEDLEEFMELFKKRSDGGLGVGSKPGVSAPDGIEIKLISLGRDAPSPATVKKEGDALEEMGYAIAAMAEVIHAKGGPKGKAKDWSEWSSDLRVAAVKLADAAKGRAGADIKAAASKINASCNSCHSKYRK